MDLFTVLVADNCIQVNIYVLTVAFNTAPPEETGFSVEEPACENTGLGSVPPTSPRLYQVCLARIAP